MSVFKQMVSKINALNRYKDKTNKGSFLEAVTLPRKLEKLLRQPNKPTSLCLLEIIVSALFLLDYPGLYSTQQVA